MRLFELRACWKEYYNCPDDSKTYICDTYDTVAFAVDDDTPLKEIAADLAKGFVGHWNESRANALHRLYPAYDDFRDTEYKIVDVTDLIVTPNTAHCRNNFMRALAALKEEHEMRREGDEYHCRSLCQSCKLIAELEAVK
ncbi:MAG: hypothetical protein FJ279_03610 [Planctomycetes bacterium]|nr:hypothetical protein [Planctomycetota bacterium]